MRAAHVARATLIVSVVCTASAAAAAGAPADSGIRFASRPIVAFTRASPGSGWNYTLVARFDRPLPRNEGGSVDATFLVDGAEPAQGVFAVGVRARHCYAQVLDTGDYPATLRHPKRGRRVSFRVDFPGTRPSVRARIRLERGSTDLETPYARRLGCYRKRRGASRGAPTRTAPAPTAAGR